MAAALVVALTVALIVAPVAHADLTTGRDKLIAGDYKGALAELPKVAGADRAEARLLLARAQLETGDYPAAESSALALAQAKDAVAPRALVPGAGPAGAGKQAERLRDPEALAGGRPDDHAARLWRGAAGMSRGSEGRRGAVALTID
ncbi:MAG: hypothetical protein IPI49_33405 [Myxococcales bacterium]|nr:hypothetical protein [Myxococcales bacterium]